MKSFRRILIPSLLALFAFGTVLYTSCKSKCGSTVCQNGGTCSDNICVCPIGYSGNACQTGWSDAIVGTFTCTQSDCVPGVTGTATSWQSAVVKDATNGGYTIDIENFDNSGETQVAIVDSSVNYSQSVSISQATGAYGVIANGDFSTYTNDTIKLTFTTSSLGGVGGYTCQMLMVRLN